MKAFVILLINCFAIINFHQVLSADVRCPTESVIAPCTCRQTRDMRTEIACRDQVKVIDLKKVFSKLAKDDDLTIFDELTIKNTTITEIPENTFEKLGFKTIEIISNPELTGIHPLAFDPDSSFPNITRKFRAVNNPKLGAENPEEEDGKLFAFLKTLTGAEEIILTNNGIEMIPDDAFGDSGDQPMTKLRILDLSFNRITTIGSSAFFAIKKLIKLDLSNNDIKSISPDGLAVDEDSSRLTIDLSNNQKLNFIDSEVFGARVTRPLNFNLTMTDLPDFGRNVFEPVLRLNGTVVITGIDLTTCDCGLKWLFTTACVNKRKTQLVKSVTGLRCKGKEILSIERSLDNCDIVDDIVDPDDENCGKKPEEGKPKLSSSRTKKDLDGDGCAQLKPNVVMLLISTVFLVNFIRLVRVF